MKIKIIFLMRMSQHNCIMIVMSLYLAMIIKVIAGMKKEKLWKADPIQEYYKISFLE